MASAGNQPPDWRQFLTPARQGDRAARTSLYEVFASTVHAIVLAHVGAKDADDLTQDVFCAVFTSLPRLREPDAFAGYLCATARNAARDHLRRQKRAPKQVPDADLLAGDRSPHASLVGRETTERIMTALRELPEAYRETLLLRLLSGLSGAEISERTGMTHGSVRVNLARGMGMLRERLAGLLPEVLP